MPAATRRGEAGRGAPGEVTAIGGAAAPEYGEAGAALKSGAAGRLAVGRSKWRLPEGGLWHSVATKVGDGS